MNPQAPLSPAERSALRARAHALDPVVMVSGKGVTESVLAEIERNLDHHELIKVRILQAERTEREAMMARICELTGAQPVQHIGKILVVFRHRPASEQANPAAAPPARPEAAFPRPRASGAAIPPEPPVRGQARRASPGHATSPRKRQSGAPPARRRGRA